MNDILISIAANKHAKKIYSQFYRTFLSKENFVLRSENDFTAGVKWALSQKKDVEDIQENDLKNIRSNGYSNNDI